MRWSPTTTGRVLPDCSEPRGAAPAPYSLARIAGCNANARATASFSLVIASCRYAICFLLFT